LFCTPGKFPAFDSPVGTASGEIEACLFALQAAMGGIQIGGVFGYWIGQKKKA